MSEPFRVTYWPGGAQPIPPLAVPERVEREGHWLGLDLGPGVRAVEMPTEFHRRECLDVDLDDLDAVCDLVRRFGSPVPLGRGTLDLPGPPEWVGREIARQAARAGRQWPQSPPKQLLWWVHVDDVIYRLRVLRQLSAHAVAYRRGDYVADAWPAEQRERNAEGIAAWRLGEGQMTENDPRHREALEVYAWKDFIEFTDLALRPFHVRVWVDFGHADYDIGIPRPTLYEAGVLQIVNDLAEDVDYKECPHCGRAFGRQVGRAVHGQNRRTGVTYCSPSCSSNARVKAFRARQRAERKAKQDG